MADVYCMIGSVLQTVSRHVLLRFAREAGLKLILNVMRITWVLLKWGCGVSHSPLFAETIGKSLDLFPISVLSEKLA